MAIIARHTNSDSKQTLDRLFTATELKKVLSSYKKHTNIGAVSKMKKSQLIDVLHKLEFKLNAFDKGENQIYTFDLSTFEQDEENKHEIKRPLKKPEPKTKTKPAPKKEEPKKEEPTKEEPTKEEPKPKTKKKLKIVSTPASKPKTKKLLTSDDLFKQREAEEKKMKEEDEVFQKKKQEKLAKDKMDKYKEEQKQQKEKFENQARLRYQTDKRRFKDFSKKKLESINTKKEIEEYFRDFRDLKNEIIGYSRAGQKRINLKNREDWSKDIRNFYEKDNKPGQKKIEEMIELYNNHLNQISKKAKVLFKKK